MDEIVLTFDARTRSRGQGTSRAGIEVAWFFEQGLFPRHGDTLRSESGTCYRMVADDEPMSMVTASNHFDLMRIAYHLGNRHVPLDVRPTSLRFQPDHVLDEMVTLLGGHVARKSASFAPEDGAYHDHGNQSSHSSNHDHDHDHGHDHEHEHVHE